jgi:hypothetical protein
MQVKVIVTLDIDPYEPDDHNISKDECQAAAVEAVKEAVDFAEQNGFSHSLADVACIGVVSVESGKKRQFEERP